MLASTDKLTVAVFDLIGGQRTDAFRFRVIQRCTSRKVKIHAGFRPKGCGKSSTREMPIFSRRARRGKYSTMGQPGQCPLGRCRQFRDNLRAELIGAALRKHEIRDLVCRAYAEQLGAMAAIKSHAQAVVIGGGVVGCSILYHLAKMGWKEVVLLERTELTSGSSWHAAGRHPHHQFRSQHRRLQAYTIKLYAEIEALSGQSCGIHRPGGIYLASTPERLDYLKQERAKSRYMGLDTEFISLAEARDLNPLIDPSQYLGALFEPLDGHVDPAGVTQAYAKAAQHYGAHDHRRTPVIETRSDRTATGMSLLPSGTIRADHVINAAGLWAREVGLLAGIHLPVQPMEHHYLITETIPEIEAYGQEIAVTVDYEGNAYTRQEPRAFCWELTSPTACPGRWPGPRSISVMSYCTPTWIASPIGCRLRSSECRRWRAPGSRMSSTVPLPSGPTATPHRPGTGLAQLLGRRRRHGRILPSGRSRALDRRMDDRGRSQHRCLGHGCGALRRARHFRLRHQAGDGELLTPLHHLISE